MCWWFQCMCHFRCCYSILCDCNFLKSFDGYWSVSVVGHQDFVSFTEFHFRSSWSQYVRLHDSRRYYRRYYIAIFAISWFYTSPVYFYWNDFRCIGRYHFCWWCKYLMFWVCNQCLHSKIYLIFIGSFHNICIRRIIIKKIMYTL